MNIYLALGSNLGNRSANLRAALTEIASFATVEATSHLYETPPLYVVEQPSFLNAVCRIRTQLAPLDLLAALQEIEQRLGRRKTVRYGPRPIDLDLLFYGDLHLEIEQLILPHPRIAERDFVLEPLCDLAPDLRHPLLGRTVRELWRGLGASPLPKVMPIGNQLWHWGRKTYIMGIINATPDSFSGDGVGEGNAAAVARAVALAQQFAADGADCIDVGGISTRPGHALIPVAEEIERVVPVMRAIAREVDLPLSVDTFRADVAQAALDAGAAMVNDVWGLRYDQRIASIAARAGVPLVVMHNQSAFSHSDYETTLDTPGEPYVYGDMIAEICADLHTRLETAQAHGIPRWHLIADPGVGFGKTVDQNLDLIRRLDELQLAGTPLLVGASRKGFIGKVLGGVPPQERVEGTIATGVLALQRGAQLLRVHDVRAVSRAARVADAILG